MKNEFGTQLDSNGYAPTILCTSASCAICRRSNVHLQRHEVFHGANRTKSKNYGLWLNVCMDCHALIHRDGDLDRALKRQAQRHAMTVYKWTESDFRKRFGKNYV